MTGLSGYKLEVSSDLECLFANKASVYLIDSPYFHTGPTGAIAQESLHGRLQYHDTKQKSPRFHVRDMKPSRALARQILVMHFGVDITEEDAVSEARGQAQRDMTRRRQKPHATRLRQLVGARPK